MNDIDRDCADFESEMVVPYVPESDEENSSASFIVELTYPFDTIQ